MKQTELEYNYEKLLNEIYKCNPEPGQQKYAQVPYTIIKTFPIDMAQRLQDKGVKVTFTNDALIMSIPDDFK